MLIRPFLRDKAGSISPAGNISCRLRRGPSAALPIAADAASVGHGVRRLAVRSGGWLRPAAFPPGLSRRLRKLHGICGPLTNRFELWNPWPKQHAFDRQHLKQIPFCSRPQRDFISYDFQKSCVRVLEYAEEFSAMRNLTHDGRRLMLSASKRLIVAPARWKNSRASMSMTRRSQRCSKCGAMDWLGREGSNLRMAESKSAALPLGYAPTR